MTAGFGVYKNLSGITKKLATVRTWTKFNNLCKGNVSLSNTKLLAAWTKIVTNTGSLSITLTGRLKSIHEDLVFSGLKAIDDGLTIKYFSSNNKLIAEIFDNDFRAYEWMVNDPLKGVEMINETREGYLVVKKGDIWGIDLGFKEGRILKAEEVNDYLIEAFKGRYRQDGQPFMNGTIVTEKTLPKDDIVYFVELYLNGKPNPGAWGSNRQILTVAELRNKLAVLEAWKPTNAELVVREYKIQIPIKVRDGQIGFQIEDPLQGGVLLEGGGHQYQFFENSYFQDYKKYMKFEKEFSLK